MELHIIFFILAGLLIAILVGFSLWSARREKSEVFSNNFASRPIVVPTQHNEKREELSPVSTPNSNEYQAMVEPEETQQQIQQEVENSLQNIKISLPTEQPQIEKQIDTYGQRISVQQHIQKIEVEPEQVEMELGTPQVQSVAANPFVTLYIYAPQNEPFRGDFVVYHLEEVGLRFGEHHIFHRHQHIDNSGSPVIFSAANLINPGTFDLHNIANFSTVGLVLFMQLPTEGSDVANMKLLINNAEHLAASLGGFLYDDAQQPFNEQSRQRYMQRVMY